MKTYPERLLEIGINLLEPYTQAKTHTKMQCVTCLHEWSATPLSKLQNFKRHGNGGCPICTHSRRYDDTQAANKVKIPEHIISDPQWDGNRNFSRGKIWFHNTKCGHRFETYPNYIIAGKTDCTICGKDQRIAEMIERREGERVYDDPEKWAHYVSLVDKFTRRTYKAHKSTINPLDLPRKRNGTIGAYQLDHIVSKIEGFVRGITPERLSQVDNLQMLSWEENIAKKDKLLWIPLSMKEFFIDKEVDLTDDLLAIKE